MAGERAGGSGVGTAAARLARQHISRPIGDSVAGMVRRLVAVQAQDFAGAKWAIGLRLGNVSEAEVERAFNAGEILRTHVLRPTWHFVAPEDIRHLLLLTGPRILRQNASICRRLSLDATTLGRSARAIARALEGGRHLTREALRAVVQAAGIPAAGLQRMAYIMMHAELTGVVCSGPRVGRQFTYARLDERVPPGRLVAREAALADVAARYYRTRAPATAHDFAKWCGLTVTEASRAWAALPAPPAVRPARDAPRVHLLSIYDEYVSSYRDRSAIVSPDHGRRLVNQGAALVWAIVLDGQIVGTWRRVVARGRVTIEPTLFVRFSRAERDALGAAARRYGAFLGLPVDVMDAQTSRRAR
jgi:hypothetical protein